jgi:hypothetical protein
VRYQTLANGLFKIHSIVYDLVLTDIEFTKSCTGGTIDPE